MKVNVVCLSTFFCIDLYIIPTNICTFIYVFVNTYHHFDHKKLNCLFELKNQLCSIKCIVFTSSFLKLILFICTVHPLNNFLFASLFTHFLSVFFYFIKTQNNDYIQAHFFAILYITFRVKYEQHYQCNKTIAQITDY